MKALIAIDPGAHGAIAWRDPEGNIGVSKMPDTPKDIYDLLKELYCEDSIAYLEDVGHGMPGQSSKATAMFARHNGHLEMALIAAGYSTVKATPQKWQKHFSNTLGKSAGIDKRVWKNKLKALSQQLFPQFKITLDTADALLILKYAIEKEK